MIERHGMVADAYCRVPTSSASRFKLRLTRAVVANKFSSARPLVTAPARISASASSMGNKS
jgi:hypothetical protein